MTKVLTPTQLANLAIDQLKNCADPQVAQQMRRYFKEHDEIDLLGVKTPGITEIVKQLLVSRYENLEFVAQLLYSVGSCFLRIIYTQYFHGIYIRKTPYKTRISRFILVHSESISFHNYSYYNTRFRGST